MFTVIVAFEGSGKSSKRRPFCSLYSVIPSTEVTRSMPCGNAAVGCCAEYNGTRDTSRNRQTEINLARFMVESSRVRLLSHWNAFDSNQGVSSPLEKCGSNGTRGLIF